MKRLETFKAEWKDCVKCDLSKVRTQVVFGVGNPEARLVFIGEAPGRDEDIQGIPFVGQAGKLFDKILESVGIKREDIWITNTCLCRPKINAKGKKNRAPVSKEIEACRPRLQEEMKIIKPEIIVLAGNTPLYMATKMRGIVKQRGWVIEKKDCGYCDGCMLQARGWHMAKCLERPKTAIYATLHPASLLYGSAEQIADKKLMVWEDWKKIAEALNE